MCLTREFSVEAATARAQAAQPPNTARIELLARHRCNRQSYFSCARCQQTPQTLCHGFIAHGIFSSLGPGMSSLPNQGDSHLLLERGSMGTGLLAAARLDLAGTRHQHGHGAPNAGLQGGGEGHGTGLTKSRFSPSRAACERGGVGSRSGLRTAAPLPQVRPRQRGAAKGVIDLHGYPVEVARVVVRAALEEAAEALEALEARGEGLQGRGLTIVMGQGRHSGGEAVLQPAVRAMLAEELWPAVAQGKVRETEGALLVPASELRRLRRRRADGESAAGVSPASSVAASDSRQRARGTAGSRGACEPKSRRCGFKRDGERRVSRGVARSCPGKERFGVVSAFSAIHSPRVAVLLLPGGQGLDATPRDAEGAESLGDPGGRASSWSSLSEAMPHASGAVCAQPLPIPSQASCASPLRRARAPELKFLLALAFPFDVFVLCVFYHMRDDVLVWHFGSYSDTY